MSRSMVSQVGRYSALLWPAVTTVYLLVLSSLILGDARFPLNLGLIRTIGRSGLWITLAPAVVGVAAVLLVVLQKRSGAAMLGVYCWFWIGVLASGLPFVWNARESFCTPTECIRTPWIGRLLLLGMMALFVTVALWAKHEFGSARRRVLPT